MSSLGTGFDTLLTRGALVALAAAAGWAVLVIASVALEARTAGRIRVAEHTGCPAAVRRWLLALFVACFAGVAAPAAASGPGSDPGSGGAGGSVVASLEGLPLPDRTTGDPGSRPRPRGTFVLVRSGDSLWSLARATVPDGASDAAIAAAMHELYAANRHLIGDDPDLIIPGQRLRIRPPTATTTSLSEER